MRLFVGLELPWEVRERLAELSGSGIPGARWVPIENYHLTLRFIGEVPPYRAEELDEALAALRGKRFAFELSGVGTFAKGGRRRCGWGWRRTRSWSTWPARWRRRCSARGWNRSGDASPRT